MEPAPFRSIGGEELTEEELATPRRCDFGPIGSKPATTTAADVKNPDSPGYVFSWVSDFIGKDTEFYENKDLRGILPTLPRTPQMIEAMMKERSSFNGWDSPSMNQPQSLNEIMMGGDDTFKISTSEQNKAVMGLQSIALGSGRPLPVAAATSTSSRFGREPLREIKQPLALPPPLKFNNPPPTAATTKSLFAGTPCKTLMYANKGLHNNVPPRTWTPPDPLPPTLPSFVYESARVRSSSSFTEQPPGVQNEETSTMSNASSGYDTGGEPLSPPTAGQKAEPPRSTTEADMNDFITRYGLSGEVRPSHLYRRRKGKYFKEF